MPVNETYLQMLQNNIARMSAQSTTVKSWSIALTVTLLGAGTTAAQPLVALLAVYVVVTFALLDSYYLAMERGFRALWARATNPSSAVEGWELSPPAPTTSELGKALRSPSIAPLYVTSAVVALTVSCYTAVTHK